MLLKSIVRITSCSELEQCQEYVDVTPSMQNSMNFATSAVVRAFFSLSVLFGITFLRSEQVSVIVFLF